VLGAVELDVDWTVPLAPMRAALDRTLEASTIWDGRVGILQVTDAVGSFVRLRVLVSGVDGPTVFDLRCEVREALIDHLQRTCPESLPRIRVDGAATVRRDGDTDQTSVGDQQDAVRLEARPVESESESTRTQGLFTGSAEAAERARGFTRPTQPDPTEP